MRTIAIIVLILGVASLVFGIIFVTHGSSGRQEVADNIAPLPLDQLEDRYDQVTAEYRQMKEQMEAAGAPRSIDSNYLALTKTGLGLSRANAGTSLFIMYIGIVDIIIGAGLILAGVGLLKKSSSAA